MPDEKNNENVMYMEGSSTIKPKMPAPPAPEPEPSSGGSSNTLVIILAIVGVLVVLAILGFCVNRCMQKRRQTQAAIGANLDENLYSRTNV